MTVDRIPVLWLYGPPGVGKSTIGWRIFADLRRSGTACGFVDIDQLGICYPESVDDQGRHRLKVQNLAAVIESYRAAGARCVVVSGVVDAEHGVDRSRLGGATLTLSRLRADRAELAQRLTARGDAQYDLDDIWQEATALDRGLAAETAVDTSGLTVEEATARVLRDAGRWPAFKDEAPPVAAPIRPAAVRAGVDLPILWLCGPTGVGKSAAGFLIFMQQLGADRAAAFLDLDQVGFCEPAPIDDPHRHRVKSSTLASAAQAFQAAGAQCLVVVGPVASESEIKRYTDALPDATCLVVRLHAEPAELSSRIIRRGDGDGWAQPGDPLLGRPAAKLLAAAARAISDDSEWEDRDLGDLRVDSTGQSATQVADAILERSGWPVLR